MKLGALVVSYIGILSVQSALALPARSPQSNQKMANTQPATTKLEFGGFTVKVELSEKAKKTLINRKESIVVDAYFTGVPTPAALQRGTCDCSMGEIGLGQFEREILPGEAATFQKVDLAITKGKLDQIRGDIRQDGPRLLINVFSGRKFSRNNLLDCDTYEGPLKTVEGQDIDIFCKLIEE